MAKCRYKEKCSEHQADCRDETICGLKPSYMKSKKEALKYMKEKFGVKGFGYKPRGKRI
jgi:hypothetical protein